MQILLNTDNNVEVEDTLLQRVEADIKSGLSRFSDKITRVEIYVSDENAEKAGGTDKRCMLEARPTGQQPVAVTHNAGSVDEACTGALHKLEALLETKYGRSDNRKGGPSIRHLPVEEGLS
ncbi:HPF/RaiA family ribosome-associated protein [Micromonosporaceae bacterium Da 78-11]